MRIARKNNQKLVEEAKKSTWTASREYAIYYNEYTDRYCIYSRRTGMLYDKDRFKEFIQRTVGLFGTEYKCKQYRTFEAANKALIKQKKEDLEAAMETVVRNSWEAY